MTSPDGAVTIEQYVYKATDDWKWQFWARRQGTFTQLVRIKTTMPRIFASPMI